MNKQEVFNKVATHLLTQNAKALDRGGLCVYETQLGLRCAVGCLIPDDHKGLQSGADAEALFGDYPDLAELYSIDVYDESTDLLFIMELQSVHDEIVVDGWKLGLKNCAKNWNLKHSVLENF